MKRALAWTATLGITLVVGAFCQWLLAWRSDEGSNFLWHRPYLWLVYALMGLALGERVYCRTPRSPTDEL